MINGNLGDNNHLMYCLYVLETTMFSGFTNQMSSISSWIGAKKAGAPSEETSPQNPEEPVVAEAVASSPGLFRLRDHIEDS